MKKATFPWEYPHQNNSKLIKAMQTKASSFSHYFSFWIFHYVSSSTLNFYLISSNFLNSAIPFLLFYKGISTDHYMIDTSSFVLIKRSFHVHTQLSEPRSGLKIWSTARDRWRLSTLTVHPTVTRWTPESNREKLAGRLNSKS